ncbi:MAG: glycosyltransferase family 2 protein [Christensenella sp.]|uniref:glycosyltransferase family 2 protein n=1 Tax=Christensenella sp. TaxID=1935934 RepID=UPI002B219D04|nr:glycosyltransferase family 2 protein [Christensenella sp.]MEA5001884.1 glycosyltransferase family 2 protein [Christensenella sp.]
MKDLLIFIPAHNEQDNIEKVACDLREHCSAYDFVVIDDGSTDDTVRICKENDIPVMPLPVNLGLDGVFQTGNKYAYLNGYERTVQFDGDGQHSAKYIAALMQKMDEGYDIVVGSRFVSEKKPGGLRMMGSRIISGAFKLTTGQRLNDPTSGMRLIDRKVMKQVAYDPNCGEEPDTWAYFVRKGAKLTEVQVEMSEREAGQSYLTFGRSIAYMFRMMVSMIFINLFRGGREK